MDTARPQVYPGVDWLTLTTGPGETGHVAWSKARGLAVETVVDGNRLRPWGAHGYKGFATPHLRCGRSADDTIVELSGALADRYWREFLPFARNVTRLDTKVDVTFSRPVKGLAEDAYRAPGVKRNRRLPPIDKALYTGTAGGQTCYVGAMGGRRLGRLYDKSAESPRDTQPNTWRYELQERKPYCGLVVGALDNVDDVPRYLAAHVHGFFARHGINPWFEADSIDLPSLPRRQHTDMSAWLDWYKRQVAPGVRRWINSGHGDAIRHAIEEAHLGEGDRVH